jgi:hypothetical protein
MTDADATAAIVNHVRAFNDRDVDAVMSGFTDDACRITGSSVIGGRAEVAEFFTSAWPKIYREGSAEPARRLGSARAPPVRARAGRRGAEPVEFPEPRAAEEGIPFSPREPQDRSSRVPAVADADRAAGQFRHLDAVAVGEAQGTLHPDHGHLLTPCCPAAVSWPGFPAVAKTFDESSSKHS